MLAFITLVVCTASLSATDYYVSPSGSDATGNGGFANPWKTIAFAIDRIFPGDILFLRAGEYHEQLITIRSGTSSAYITIAAYGNEAAFIDGKNVSSGNNGCLISHSYLRLRGFTVRNWLHDGMTISNCSYIELKKVKVTAVTGGISLKNTVHDFVLDSCIMYDYFGGAGGLGFDATPEGPNDRIYNGVIKNCKAYLTAGAFDNCDGFALGHDGVSNIRFSDCETFGTGDGFDISGTGILLERCSAHGSSYGGGYKLWRDSVMMVNCIGYDNSTNVELDFDPSTNKGVKARLVNCTFFGAWNANIWIENTTGGSTLEMYNCILAGSENTGLFFDGDNIQCYRGDYNLFHMNVPDRTIATSTLDYSLSQIQSGEWTTASGQDAHSVIATDASSVFKDTSRTAINLHLKAGAVAINRGSLFPFAPQTDFDNRSRSDGRLDIGAYEYNSSTDAVERERSTGVANFVLHQNHPNPFSHSTLIPFTLPSRSHVTLEVFDILGRKVATLVDGVREAGEHSVGFKTQDLKMKIQPGVYFYRLRTNGSQAIKKMVVAQ